METVSSKFQSYELYMVDVIAAANAMQIGIQTLKEKCQRKGAQKTDRLDAETLVRLLGASHQRSGCQLPSSASCEYCSSTAPA
ncbi:MAG: hypothetical protein HPY58_03195 [Firmicutes bacterium]|nr:hypothetical protein [Bacillota bacterium]